MKNIIITSITYLVTCFLSNNFKYFNLNIYSMWINTFSIYIIIVGLLLLFLISKNIKFLSIIINSLFIVLVLITFLKLIDNDNKINDFSIIFFLSLLYILNLCFNGVRAIYLQKTARNYEVKS